MIILDNNYNKILNNIITLGIRKQLFILAIDGRSCGGKSVFANLLAEKTGATVFKIDDYYLPFEKRTYKTILKPASHIDLQRFKAEVLVPVSKGKEVKYTPFNCGSGKFEGTRIIKPVKFIIVEGAYSHHPHLANFYDYRLFINISPSKQEERIIKRNGQEKFLVFKEQWIPAEEKYLQEYNIQSQSDEILDTSLTW